MTPRGRSGGETPERVIKLVKEAVAKSSQSAVARESGVALLTVQRCLKGVGEPSQATLEKLAGYFGVTVAWLRGEDEPSEMALFIEAFQKYISDLGKTMPMELINDQKAFFEFADKLMLKHIEAGNFKGLSKERIDHLKKTGLSGLHPS